MTKHKISSAEQGKVPTPDQVTYDYNPFHGYSNPRVIKNGKANKPYLPKDPRRRRRLLKKLGISDDATSAE
jgi:hypothetical protein